MACNCPSSGMPVRGPAAAKCRFRTETRVWWAPRKSCYVFRCANPAMLTSPPEWAFGNTRKATVGDSPGGEIIEGADWIAVRSCFCRCAKCPHFSALNAPETGRNGPNGT